MRRVHGHAVHGVDVDPETRCTHYDTERDVIALRFPCCDRFYPCFECHQAVTSHEPAQWSQGDDAEPAILCGVCGTVLSIREYLDSEDRCPACEAGFNPGCRTHYQLYFDDALVE